MQAFPPIDSQLAFFNNLGQNSAKAIQEINALNLKLTQQLTEDAALSYQQLMACGDPWQLVTTVFKRMQPVNEHLQHYQRQLLAMLVPTSALH